jgi:hypothetical protein
MLGRCRCPNKYYAREGELDEILVCKNQNITVDAIIIKKQLNSHFAKLKNWQKIIEMIQQLNCVILKASVFLPFPFPAISGDMLCKRMLVTTRQNLQCLHLI